MALVDLVMPKMGESIMEATILKWEKQVGDTVEIDEDILLIATDKVDTEVPSPVEGVIQEILYQENDVVAVGEVIARIATEGETVNASPAVETPSNPESQPELVEAPAVTEHVAAVELVNEKLDTSSSERFYSPLVKSIAEKENIGLQELETIHGTGAGGRVTKKDILSYLDNRTAPKTQQPATKPQPQAAAPQQVIRHQAPKVNITGEVEIIEMDRMRKLIADHMVMSKQVSPHVTSYVEADVTNLVNWRNKHKKPFQERYGERLTFTPLFIEAVVKGIKDFPMINVSVDGDKIILKKYINIGMAAALPSGNLIVPVIKNADFMNLAGLTKSVNDLAGRARSNKLKPDEIQDGTFTLTNVGTFGNLSGTPIINQPQVAIMSTGVIRKKPAVLETEHGDVIAIRHMMMISLSYDHRVVDGFLGGSYLRRVADYLEQFDVDREI
ncbi:MAG: dihydrolipoamide acetyltransferase family protein [Bacteroidota bacterium]